MKNSLERIHELEEKIKKLVSKLEKSSDSPCNYTNQIDDRRNTEDKTIKTICLEDSKPKRNSTKKSEPTKRIILNNESHKTKQPKRVYKYCKDDFPRGEEKKDANRRESKAVHRKICRVYRDGMAKSFDKRSLTHQQRQILHGLCGIRGRHCMQMFASDIELRKHLGYAVINEFYRLWCLSQIDPELEIYHITPLSDKFQFSIRNGVADVHGTIEKFSHVVRQYTSFNVFGVYEAQAILNQTDSRKNETLYGHLHCLAYTRDPDDARILVERAKGYSAKLTKIPILAQRLGSKEGDLTRTARYICKPPYEGKKVCKRNYEAGKPCIRSTIKGVRKYHQFRLLELQSKLPLENTLFGVGEGVAMKTRILRHVRNWHQNRDGKPMNVDCSIANELYAAILHRNEGRLGEYKPMKVIHKRSTK